MDGHGIGIGVVPHAAVLHTVDNDACGGVAPFLKVAVGEGLGHAHIHHTVVRAAPVVAGGAGEADGAVVEGDVVQPAGAAVAETGVGGGDGGHHTLHGGTAGPAVAPGQGGVSPVDGQDSLVATLAHPVEDVLRGDGGLGHRRAVGVGGGDGGGHGKVATSANLHDVAIAHGVAGVADGSPVAVDGVAPVVVVRGQGDAVLGIGGAGHSGGGAVVEAAVIGLDTVDQVECRGGAVPMHAPGVGCGGGVVVPGDDDDSRIASCAHPELDVRGGEGDGGRCTACKHQAQCQCK